MARDAHPGDARPAFQVARLSLDEGPRLRHIRLRALADAPDAFGSTLVETRARPSESWDQQVRDLETYVAVVGGRDVGMVRGIRSSEHPDAAFLLSMWVDPAVRGRGVGRALVAALVRWAEGAAFGRLLLDVADDNAPAVALYASMGFVPNGVVGSLPPPRDHIREHQRELVLAR